MAYFSRPGENYYYGGRRDLEVGNTEVLARIIAELIGCDVYRIEATDPYPDGYDATVARNVTEQNADERPAIANPLASIERYDRLLLGSPIWNVRPPMILSTFAESYDFTGKTVHPFVTYAVSGLGSTERDYTEALCRRTDQPRAGRRKARQPSTETTSSLAPPERTYSAPDLSRWHNIHSRTPRPDARPVRQRKEDHGQATAGHLEVSAIGWAAWG
jgi:flavodoxin